MPDFFVVFAAILAAIEDGKVTHGEVTYADEDPEGHSVTLTMTVARHPLGVVPIADDD